MGSPDSWIDVDELAELGRQLVGPTPSVPAPAPPPHVFAGDSEELPTATMVDRWRRQLAEIRARAERNGLVGEEPATVGGPGRGSLPSVFVPDPFELPAETTLVARMRAFAEWLRNAFDPEASFGADDLGFPILGAQSDPALVASALALCRAWHATGSRVMGAPSAMASSAIAGRGFLSVFPVVEGGAFRFVAMLTERPVGGEAANRISAAFRAAMGRDSV